MESLLRGVHRRSEASEGWSLVPGQKGVNLTAGAFCAFAMAEAIGDGRMWEGQVLLLLNSHSDTIDLLTDWFSALGARVHHARTADLCGNPDQARSLVETVKPTVVLFDLAIPYARNWHCFQHVANSGVFAATPIV